MRHYSDHEDAFDHETIEKDPNHNSQRVATGAALLRLPGACLHFTHGRRTLPAVLMFLSGLPEGAGGETVFPSPLSEWATPEQEAAAARTNFSECARRGPAVVPQEGDAILFWSVNLDGTEDHAALHASCPVLVDNQKKYTATKWCASFSLTSILVLSAHIVSLIAGSTRLPSRSCLREHDVSIYMRACRRWQNARARRRRAPPPRAAGRTDERCQGASGFPHPCFGLLPTDSTH